MCVSGYERVHTQQNSMANQTVSEKERQREKKMKNKLFALFFVGAVYGTVFVEE